MYGSRRTAYRQIAHKFGTALFVILMVLFGVGASADHGPETYAAAHVSVVVIEPTWPGYNRPGFGAPPGSAPAGSGVYFGVGQHSHYLVTAAHVVTRASRVEIVSNDGLRQDVEIVAIDRARDIAVLRSPEPSTPIVMAGDTPPVGLHACAIGNSFGLGLSFSCGVVSAINRRNVGFNAIEDFVQTDAAINPGASGGALVDPQGRLIGLIDGIFTKEADIDAGVNFAISVPMLKQSLQELRAENPSIPNLD